LKCPFLSHSSVPCSWLKGLPVVWHSATQRNPSHAKATRLERWRVCVSLRRAAAHAIDGPVATPDHAMRASIRPRRILARTVRVVVAVIPVGAPLAYIPMHVV